MSGQSNKNTLDTYALGCFGKIVQEILDTVVSVVLFILSYVLLAILIILIADNTQSIRLLSGIALFAITFALIFFLKALQAQSGLIQIEQDALKFRDKTKSLFKYIFSFEAFVTNYFRRKIYSLAGILVSVTAIFSDFLIEIGSGDFMDYFNFNNWTPDYVVLAILPFFAGIIADWLKRKKSELLSPNFAVKILIYFSVLKFYPYFILFLTGLIGGREAFFPASQLNDLLSLKFFLFDWIPNSYIESSSYKLAHSINTIWFILLYFVIPLIIFFDTKKLRIKYDGKAYNQKNTPMSFVNAAYYLSICILTIPLYVGWNEKWFQSTIEYIFSYF